MISTLNEKDQVLELWISRILRYGVWSSAGIMALGIILAWVSGAGYSLPGEQLLPGDALKNLATGSITPTTLMVAGLLILVLTPFLRVLTAAIGFAAEKDRPFVLVSLVIFAMLLGEMMYSLR